MLQHFLLSTSSDSEGEEDEQAVMIDDPPLTWNAGSAAMGGSKKKSLSKQLSMKETTREARWEKRRRQIVHRRHMMMEEGDDEEKVVEKEPGDVGERRMSGRGRSLTDEDLDELKGCIELGFGFSEEEGGHDLRHTLPALDLYFAVNRQISDPKLRSSPSPASTPTSTSYPSTWCGLLSPRSPDEQTRSGSSEAWKIFNPGADLQHHVNQSI
ncbi:hypothetical protein B296_00028237 [Ensete ventricosum]|uniref:DUF1685 domain-containing protein n=1 Tax=Ensete ventricosum TaxID=4639 RepID=A0A426Z4D1_ENSVE|nr:hypothetical protein B296_00028237 [Ensete ventricosum]